MDRARLSARAGILLGVLVAWSSACSDDSDGDGTGGASSGTSGAGARGGSAGVGVSGSAGVAARGGTSSGGGAVGGSSTGGRGGSTAGGISGVGGASSGSGGGKALAGSGPMGGSSGRGSNGGTGNAEGGAPAPRGGSTGTGDSPYEIECHGETVDCGDPTALLCLGLRAGDEVFGYSCSNECATDSDCSDLPSSAEAAPGCVDFVSTKYCLLVCKDHDDIASCPGDMYCYVYPGSTIGYCLWQ